MYSLLQNLIWYVKTPKLLNNTKQRFVLFSGPGKKFCHTTKRRAEYKTPLFVYNYFLSPKRSIKERYLSISMLFKYDNNPRL
jgi:hypothetical protein